MAHRKNTHLIYQPRAAAITQAKGDTIQAQLSSTTCNWNLFSCLTAKLSAATSNLWTSLTHPTESLVNCSEEATDVLARLTYQQDMLKQQAQEQEQEQDASCEEDIRLPQKRTKDSGLHLPEKRMKQEGMSIRRTYGTQTATEETTQTEEPKFKPRNVPRWLDGQQKDYKTMKELSLMRFAMRLPNMNQEQLRKPSIHEEFSREYESSLPFYKSIDEIKKPKSGERSVTMDIEAAKPTKTVAEPAVVAEKPRLFIKTPEQTPENLNKTELTVITKELSRELREVPLFRPETHSSAKPTQSFMQPQEVLHKSKDLEIISDPELSHPQIDVKPNPYAFSKVQEAPSNPFLSPVKQGGTQLPYIFGGHTHSTQSSPDSSDKPQHQPVFFSNPSMLSPSSYQASAPWIQSAPNQIKPQKLNLDCVNEDVNIPYSSKLNPFAISPTRQTFIATPTFGSFASSAAFSTSMFQGDTMSSTSMSQGESASGGASGGGFNLGQMRKIYRAKLK
mmetsp:Transcript_12177/g.23106  ORF Transcript_12177/g.23106 Transcript_12177/m.23106 type:complete len:504 (-) Transcript_12177:19-1530(-)